MNAKRLFVGLVSLIMTIFAVSAVSSVYAKDVKLSIGTGGTGGGYYPMGGSIAAVITEKIMGVSASGQVTGASLENIKLIQKNNTQLGLMSAGVAYGYRDKQLVRREYEGVSSIMSAGSADVVIVTLKDSPIKKAADLKGKRVGIGSPGSATEVINKLALSALGLYDIKTNKAEFKPAYLSFAEMTSSLKDKRLDAAMYFITGRPGSAILDLAMVRDIKLIGFKEETIKKIEKMYPFLSRTDYQKGLYKGVDYEILTIKGVDVFACGADLPVDLVYNITKVVHESLPHLRKTAHHGFKAWGLDRSVGGIFPMHPGAKKYYDELNIK